MEDMLLLKKTLSIFQLHKKNWYPEKQEISEIFIRLSNKRRTFVSEWEKNKLKAIIISICPKIVVVSMEMNHHFGRERLLQLETDIQIDDTMQMLLKVHCSINYGNMIHFYNNRGMKVSNTFLSRNIWYQKKEQNNQKSIALVGNIQFDK